MKTKKQVISYRITQENQDFRKALYDRIRKELDMPYLPDSDIIETAFDAFRKSKAWQDMFVRKTIKELKEGKLKNYFSISLIVPISYLLEFKSLIIGVFDCL